MSRTKIGYFGGTFDPPHIGHLVLASEAAHQFKLSRLYWGLTPDPPHKQEQAITPLPHRLEMLKLMVADNASPDYSGLYAEIPRLAGKVDFINALVQPLSSREIRWRVKEGGVYRCYTLPSVSDYIEKHHLYRGKSK